eukprot:6193129-Pleurochrysis_carterae.AAC.5
MAGAPRRTACQIAEHSRAPPARPRRQKLAKLHALTDARTGVARARRRGDAARLERGGRRSSMRARWTAGGTPLESILPPS